MGELTEPQYPNVMIKVINVITSASFCSFDGVRVNAIRKTAIEMIKQMVYNQYLSKYKSIFKSIA